MSEEEIEYKVNSEKIPPEDYWKLAESFVRNKILDIDKYNTNKDYYYIVIKVKL